VDGAGVSVSKRLSKRGVMKGAVGLSGPARSAEYFEASPRLLGVSEVAPEVVLSSELSSITFSEAGIIMESNASLVAPT
jgi:hypothetical protein